MEQTFKIPSTKTLHISYPLVWLIAVALAVYIPTFFYGYTELDDFILILRSDRYNEHLYSLVNAFHRGVFDISNSHYYRPIFLDSIILNYQLCGKNPAGYHIVNTGLHMATVALLYRLYLKLGVSELDTFILCLLFAVHPVLSQAVAWIPGRNDVLLAIFTFAFFICTITYTDNGKIKHLLLATFFLLLACFTKESGLMAPFAACLLLLIILRKKWTSHRMVVQYALWAGCIALFAAMRATAHQSGAPQGIILMGKEFIYRLPLILQYLGKVFFPFNLCVYPSLKQTTIVYGILASVITALVIGMPKHRSWRNTIAGGGIFLLFLLPLLLLLPAMSNQTFEHRLYLPITGFLLILPQTSLLRNRFTQRQLLTVYVIIAGILAVINLSHQRSFASPYSFWGQAAASNPHSAHALMVLAAKVKDPKVSYQLFCRAYSIQPKEKFLDFWRGVKLQKEDSVLASVPYLLAACNSTGYYESYYYLARAAVKNNNFKEAVDLLQQYLIRIPDNTSHSRNKQLDNPVWLYPTAAYTYAAHTAHPALAVDILKQMGYVLNN